MKSLRCCWGMGGHWSVILTITECFEWWRASRPQTLPRWLMVMQPLVAVCLLTGLSIDCSWWVEFLSGFRSWYRTSNTTRWLCNRAGQWPWICEICEICGLCAYAEYADADWKSHPHIPHTEGIFFFFLKGNKSLSYVVSGGSNS